MKKVVLYSTTPPVLHLLGEFSSSLFICFIRLRVVICLVNTLKHRYGHVSMDKQRQRLPVYRYRTAILYLVEKHATTIIVGETGSGKTTQIPQVYCLIMGLLWFELLFFELFLFSSISNSELNVFMPLCGQYLKEAGWAEGGRVIACTQPRRLAVQVWLWSLVAYFQLRYWLLFSSLFRTQLVPLCSLLFFFIFLFLSMSVTSL